MPDIPFDPVGKLQQPRAYIGTQADKGLPHLLHPAFGTRLYDPVLGTIERWVSDPIGGHWELVGGEEAPPGAPIGQLFQGRVLNNILAAIGRSDGPSGGSSSSSVTNNEFTTIVNPGGGAAAFHGVVLTGADGTGVLGHTSEAVGFNGNPIDTDGYTSTIPYTLGHSLFFPFAALNVPIGAAAVIPAGLAGYYLVSCQVGYQYEVPLVPTTSDKAFDIELNVNSSVPTIASKGRLNLPASQVYFDMLEMPGRVYQFAEGDRIWLQFDNDNNDGLGMSYRVESKQTFLSLQFLGAA